MPNQVIRTTGVLAVLAAFGAVAAPTSFSADGNAVIAGGDRAAAVQRATRTAEAQAVGDALKTMGDSDEDAESLLEQHRAVIIKSSKAGKEVVDGNVVSVAVTVTIDTDALAKVAGVDPAKAKAAKAKGGGAGLTGKRVIVLATEQLGPREIIGWSDFAFSFGPGSASASSKTKLIQLVDEMGGLDATIASSFTDAGFDVIDPTVLKGKLSKPQLRVIDLSAPQATQIAEKADADVVIVVKGTADNVYHEALAEAGMHSGSGTVVARAIRVRDGKVLSSSTQQAAKVHVDFQTARILALNEAAKLASAELLRKLHAD